MKRLLRNLLILPGLAAAFSGCALSGSMSVQPVAVSSQRPGNVALFVAVSQHGEAVPGLDARAFKVYENGVALNNAQIQLTLLPTSSAATEQAAVLVDMSKSLSAEDKKALSASLRSFIIRLRQRQGVSLYAFDGSPKIHLVAEFPKDARAEPDEKDTSLDRLLAFARKDSSSSLYTAVLEGSDKLTHSLDADGRPIERGTVIMIALNPDLAGRVDEGKVRDYIDHSPHQFYLLTVGTWATSTDASFLGKDGTVRAASVHTLSSPLDRIASQMDNAYFLNYLVSYCSPARAGTRDLRLEVSTTNAQGKKSVGRYETQFDATGFGPGCNPQAPPRFVLQRSKDDGARLASETAHSASQGSAKRANPKRPASTDNAENPSAAGQSSNSGAAPAVAEPPSGLGYE